MARAARRSTMAGEATPTYPEVPFPECTLQTRKSSYREKPAFVLDELIDAQDCSFRRSRAYGVFGRRQLAERSGKYVFADAHYVRHSLAGDRADIDGETSPDNLALGAEYQRHRKRRLADDR